MCRTRGAGEVLLENDYSVISAGTERANLLNLPNTSGGFPYRPGYCGAGRVIEVGEERRERGPRRSCPRRSSRRAPLARGPTAPKVSPWSATTASRSLEAAFVVIAAMGLQGVRKLRLELGESAMVIGLGLLGIFATQLARIDGAIPVIVSDFDPKRRDLALQLGRGPRVLAG
jgi:hypothetical protein